MAKKSIGCQTVWTLSPLSVYSFCPSPDHQSESQVQPSSIEFMGQKYQSALIKRYQEESCTTSNTLVTLCSSERSPSAERRENSSIRDSHVTESLLDGSLASLIKCPEPSTSVDSDTEETIDRVKDEDMLICAADDIKPVEDSQLLGSSFSHLTLSALHSDQICQVCGDKAAGFHCGAYVCEACKKFFIRSSKQSAKVYKCTVQSQLNRCTINKETRTLCQACRYQKCLMIGMLPHGQSLIERTKLKSMKCKVCGSAASGFNFGVLSCEGCKGFFRRLMKGKKIDLRCAKNKNCPVNSTSRSMCRYCRYQKCLAVGMSQNATRIGRQPNSVRHARILQYQLMDGMGDKCKEEKNSNGDGEEETAGDDVNNDSDSESSSPSPQSTNDDLPMLTTSSIQVSESVCIEWIACLRENYANFFNGYIGEIESLQEHLVHMNDEQLAKAVFDNFVCFLQGLLCYLKKCGGFQQICLEDKISLTKVSMFRNKLLLLAQKFDLNTGQCLVFALKSDSPYPARFLRMFPEYEKSVHHLTVSGRKIKEMNMDFEEMALLTLLNVVNKDYLDNMVSPDNIIHLHNQYLQLLMFHLKNKLGDSAERLSHLMDILELCHKANVDHGIAARQVVVKHPEDEAEKPIVPKVYTEVYQT